MDDLDHVLNYLREEYQYQIWALVGHSRGNYVGQFGVECRCKCSVSLCYYTGSIYTFDCQLFGEIYI